MLSKAAKQGLVWGGSLIIIGVLALVDQVVELSPWVWVAFLAVAGLGSFGLWLTDRSDWMMLLATYVLWAIAVLVALVTLDALHDETVTFFVLPAIALPFLMFYIRNRTQWWALIPAYVLLAVALMIGLTESGLLDDELVTSYVMFAIAIPFFVVYVRNRSQWWWLIPGGIMAIIGVAFLIAEGAIEVLGALVLVLVGVWMLIRVFTRWRPQE